MNIRTSRSWLLLLALTFLVLGCKDKASSGPPPAQPPTGAPVAFVVDKVDGDTLHVRVYNFSDKKIAQWGILMRYLDAQGKVLKVKPGTAFEKDNDFWSMSGRKYTAAPKAWSAFEIDHLEIPAGTAKAEVIASRVTALAPDGATFEKEPLWQLDSHAWPDSMK